jgi:CRISPR-associated protein Csb1
MSVLEMFDMWLAPDGPVAVTMREPLEPVLGKGAVIFPPTFAPPAKGDPPNYVIDETSQGKTAIIDTVGSQANRLEPLFKLVCICSKPWGKSSIKPRNNLVWLPIVSG